MFDGDCVVARVNSGILPLANGQFARGAIKGFPDIILLYRGNFIGIEVKTKTGTQSEEQKKMENLIVRNGGLYFVVRSLDEVKKIVG